MFYLTTHSIHLNLRLHGIGHMINDPSTRITSVETFCHYFMSYSFQLAARDLLYPPSHTEWYTPQTFVTPVVEDRLEREIAQWVHQVGSIR